MPLLCLVANPWMAAPSRTSKTWVKSESPEAPAADVDAKDKSLALLKGKGKGEGKAMQAVHASSVD
eukprot:1153777-Pelagomonas_calceolata.AAC.1